MSATATPVLICYFFNSNDTYYWFLSGSRGPVFWQYLLNRQIDQDDTWPQEVLVRDLIFHHILL